MIPRVVMPRHVDFTCGLQSGLSVKATHQLSAVNAAIVDVCMSNPTPAGGYIQIGRGG